MGTQFNGKRPTNKVTVSRSATVRSVNPDTGDAVASGREPVAPANVPVPERSFAQPSPAAPVKPVKAKAHGSEKDEAEALKRNSTKPVEPEENADV